MPLPLPVLLSFLNPSSFPFFSLISLSLVRLQPCHTVEDQPCRLTGLPHNLTFPPPPSFLYAFFQKMIIAPTYTAISSLSPKHAPLPLNKQDLPISLYTPFETVLPPLPLILMFTKSAITPPPCSPPPFSQAFSCSLCGTVSDYFFLAKSFSHFWLVAPPFIVASRKTSINW